MNIGIVGTSLIADFFIGAALSLEDVKASALFSRSPQSSRVQDMCRDFGIKNVYGSFDGLCQDKDIDFIYVASPNSLHFEHCLGALKAGKNVICEKPFTSTVREAQILLGTAKAKNLMIFEGISNIHLPTFKLAKEKLTQLGQLRILQLNYSQYSRRYDALLAGETPNVFNPAFSGGSLQDINIYNVHFVVGLVGLPEAAHYFPNLHANGIDTSGVLVLQYPGFVGSLVGSKDTKGENFIFIQGEKGYLKVNNSHDGSFSVDLYLYDQDAPQIFKEKSEKNWLVYQMRDFKDIVDHKDFDACYALIQHSVDVVGLVEKARKEAGIVFPADFKA